MAIAIRKNFTTPLPRIPRHTGTGRLPPSPAPCSSCPLLPSLLPSLLPTPRYCFYKFFKKTKKGLDKSELCAIIQKLSDTDAKQQTEYGGIAQLGERLNGIQEVSGSIPLISTNPGL